VIFLLHSRDRFLACAKQKEITALRAYTSPPPAAEPLLKEKPEKAFSSCSRIIKAPSGKELDFCRRQKD